MFLQRYFEPERVMSDTRKNKIDTGQSTMTKSTTSTVLAALHNALRLNATQYFGIHINGLPRYEVVVLMEEH